MRSVAGTVCASRKLDAQNPRSVVEETPPISGQKKLGYDCLVANQDTGVLINALPGTTDYHHGNIVFFMNFDI